MLLCHISCYILGHGLLILTVLVMRKPENRFQKLRKKDITMAAIW
jgi:hypothetical protein